MKVSYNGRNLCLAYHSKNLEFEIENFVLISSEGQE